MNSSGNKDFKTGSFVRKLVRGKEQRLINAQTETLKDELFGGYSRHLMV